MKNIEKAKKCLEDITYNLEEGIIPFWMKNGVDQEFGGYLVCFDEDGIQRDDTDKMIVSQARMVWGLSHFAKKYNDEKMLLAAKQGVDFLIKKFWDEKFGGWYWKTTRDGSVLDDGKVVYGQIFVVYALSEYTLASKDSIGLLYASKTFDLLQKYCVDTFNGGYYENMENDWSKSPSGFAAGDLKSLDIHMHIMEALTTLYECSGEEIHGRKLEEVIELILTKMVNKDIGCGFNQFDVYFNRKPAINIRRTWNAERETGEVVDEPVDSTSYGHNTELVWLLNRAVKVLGKPEDTYKDYSIALIEHTLKYGFDYEMGGVFRDGPHEGAPIVKDKEWWQNCEVLVGFLDAYELIGDERYLEAFIQTWEFNHKYMINSKVGEWKQLLTQEGKEIIANIGNQWKCIYHSGRAMSECKTRLENILQ